MSADISFGEWLKRRRLGLGLTQQQLASQINYSTIALKKIEAEERRPSSEIVERLADVFNIPAEERIQFLRFARGDWQSAPPLENKDAPWRERNTFSRTNLPFQLSSFIGRRKELIEIASLIDGNRLVTLTGSGGVGKTRLSLKIGEQVLGDYAHGVWFVELAPIADPLLLPRTIAMAVGLHDEPQRPVTDMLCDYLRGKKMLLILDNCEHVVDACAHIADILLKKCPHLKILTTSREVLGIVGEAVYQVPSLPLPDMRQLLEDFRDYESVRLFEERARLVKMDFSLTAENVVSIAKICTRLDGIPLAIELAAARVNMFSIEQMASQLQENFELLTGGSRTALPRHQTLQAAIDWSYDLLSPREQILFQRLSVFVNGWTLEAAQAVASDEKINTEEIVNLLAELIKKSLVQTKEHQTITRYQMLETIRQYASEKLGESGKRDALSERHLEYFLNLAEAAEPHLIRSEQIEWLPLLDADYENLRLALEWAVSKSTMEAALNLCRALGWFWEIRCYWVEGLNWSTRVLAKPVQGVDKKERAARVGALYTRAMLEWQLNHFEQILAPAEACLALALENADRKDIAIAKYFLAGALFGRGEYGNPAPSLLRESFAEFQELDELFWQARVFSTLGYFLAPSVEPNYQDLLMQEIELARKAGERLTLADALGEYADWLFRNGQVDEAKTYAEESDRLYKQIGSGNTSLNPLLFAEIAWNNGDFQTARSLYLELEQRFRLLGARVFRAKCLGKLGLLAMEEGDLNSARGYLEEGLSLEKEIGSKSLVAIYLVELGNLFYLQGDFEQFKQKVREGFALQPHFQDSNKTFMLMAVLGSLYFQKPGVATRLLGTINNHEKRSDRVPTPIDRRYCLRAEAHARQILDNAAFESDFAEGQKMSLNEALALALSTVEEM